MRVGWWGCGQMKSGCIICIPLIQDTTDQRTWVSEDGRTFDIIVHLSKKRLNPISNYDKTPMQSIRAGWPVV